MLNKEKYMLFFISIFAFVHAVINYNKKGFTYSNTNCEKTTKRKMLPYNFSLHKAQTYRKESVC